MNIRAMSRAALVSGTAIVASLAVGSTAAEPAEIVNLPSASLQWETSAEGVGFAPLVGDRFAEPYMAMVRLPAGLRSPAHVKSANMFGVVVAGTMTHEATGSGTRAPVQLSEGAFYKVPAGLAHVSECVSATDCITFLYQDGKFDFLPAAQ